MITIILRFICTIIASPFRFIGFSIEKIKKACEGRKYRIRYDDINDIIDAFKAKPTEFENYISDIYRQKGYKTEVTQTTNDRGKDILVWNHDVSYVVEVKLYSQGYRVSREKIQKLHSAMIDSECDGAVFVTTSSFTLPAIEYAEKHSIELIDGEELLKIINE